MAGGSGGGAGGGGAAAGGFGDRPLELLAAERPAAVGRGAQIVDERRVEGVAEERPVFVLPVRPRAAERAIEFVLCQQGVGRALGVGAVARPAPVARAADEAGANRIALARGLDPRRSM